MRESKVRVSLVAAVVVMSMLAITAAATVTYLFRNDIIVSDANDIPISNDKNSPGVIGVHTPNDTPPASLEEMIESDRFKSADWANGNMIDGGVMIIQLRMVLSLSSECITAMCGRIVE